MIDDEDLGLGPDEGASMPAAEPPAPMPETMQAEPAWPTPNERHIELLRKSHQQDPSMLEFFERKFGPGSASKHLGVGVSETAQSAAATIDRATEQHAGQALATEVNERLSPLEQFVGTMARGVMNMGEASKGLFRGFYGAGEMVGEGIEQYGKTLGSEALAGFGTRMSDQNKAVAKNEFLKPRIEAYTKIARETFITDTADYLASKLGEGIGNIAPVAAFYQMGGAAGGIGFLATMSIGEVRGELKEAGIKDEGTLAQYAYVGGAAVAALEAIFPAHVLRQLSQPVKESLARHVAAVAMKGAYGGAWREGITEGLQEAVQIAAVAHAVDVNDVTNVFETEAVKAALMRGDTGERIIEAMISGAVPGGAIGGGVAGVRASQPQQPVREAKARAGSQPTATDAVPIGQTAEYTPAQRDLIAELDRAIAGGLPDDAETAQRIRDLIPPPGSDVREWRRADMASDASKLGPIRAAMGAAIADATRRPASDTRAIAPKLDEEAEPLRPGEGAVRTVPAPEEPTSEALERVRSLLKPRQQPAEEPASAPSEGQGEAVTAEPDVEEAAPREPTDEEIEADLPARAADIEQFYADREMPWDLDDTDVRAVVRNMLRGEDVETALESYFYGRHDANAAARGEPVQPREPAESAPAGQPAAEPAGAVQSEPAAAEPTGPDAQGGRLPEVGRSVSRPDGARAPDGDGQPGRDAGGQGATVTDDDRRAFARVLAGKTPRGQWRVMTGSGLTPAQMDALINEAVGDGRLVMRDGVPRRTKKAGKMPEALRQAPQAPAPTPTPPQNVARETLQQPPVIDRAMERRIERLRSDVARGYVFDLLEAETDRATGVQLLQRLAGDRKATKAVLDEIVSAYIGSSVKSKNKTDAVARIRGKLERVTEEKERKAQAEQERQQRADAEIVQRAAGMSEDALTERGYAADVALSEVSADDLRAMRADLAPLVDAEVPDAAAVSVARTLDAELAREQAAQEQQFSFLDSLNAALADAAAERQTLPEFADYGSYQRFRHIRNVMARNAGRRVHESMLDPAEFERALGNLIGTAREGQITTAELRQTVEAITGRPVGRMSWRRLEIELREEAKRRGRDLRHSMITGFPLEFAPSNLDPTDAVMDDLERLSERLPESVGVYIAPVLRTAMSRVRGGGAMAARAGLDMSPEARKARAEAMGFDTSTVWYHGTTAKFDAFDPANAVNQNERAVFLTQDQKIASAYAGYFKDLWPDGYQDMSDNVGSILPLYVRGRIKEFDFKGDKYGRADVLRQASAEGYDGVLMRNHMDAGGVQDQLAVFDPTNIRSVNAAFDEAMTDSADLMAALGPEMRWDAHRGRWVSPERTTPEAEAKWSEVLDGLPVSDAERKRLDRLVQQARTKGQQRGPGMAAQAAGEFEFEGVSLPPSQAMSLLGIDPGNYRRIMALSLAYGPDVAMQTFTHEEIHTLRAIGALSEQQWSTLAGIARKKPRAAEARRILDQMLAVEKITFREHASMVKRAGQMTMREIYGIDRRYRSFLMGMVPSVVREAGQGQIDLWIENKLLEEVVAHAAADWADGRSYGTKIDRVMFVIRDFIEAMGNFLRGNGYTNINQVFQSIWSGQVARQFDERARAAEREEAAVQRWMADNDVSAMAVRPRATPEQMFSLADRDTGRSMRRDMDALGYYSKLDEVLAGLGPKDKVTADTLQKRGVKAAEMEARDLMPMLADGKAVAVADLRETAGRNRVELREVVNSRSEPSLSEAEIARQMRDMRRSVEDVTEDDETVTYRLFGETYESEADLNVALRNAVLSIDAEAAPDPTKWSNYSLDPSNTTYRETVLHLPSTEVAQWGTFYLNGALHSVHTSEVAARSVAEGLPQSAVEQITARDASFYTGHFPEPNIVGHMMTSMVRHEGKPVYLIDQIQSDWGQKLRDGGVRDEAKIAELKAKVAKAEATVVEAAKPVRAFVRENDLSTIDADEMTEHVARDTAHMARRRLPEAGPLADALHDAIGEVNRLKAELHTAERSAPGNPLVNTTDQWVNTTLRRATRQAAEAGAAFIAIPHGDTVLSYNPGDTNGMRLFYGTSTTEGIVPKNLRKLLERIDKDAARPIKVQSLETPGRGMVSAKTPPSTIGPDDYGFTLFPLTEKVRRSVIDDGQVMFAFAGERAKTADHEALARAKEMEAAGTDRTAIWTETGWYRGRDGKWRFEIDDSGATFDNGQQSSTRNYLLSRGGRQATPAADAKVLGDALRHPELFSAYPDLAGIKLSRTGYGSHGYYVRPTWNKFKDRMMPEQIGIDQSQTFDTPRSVAMHETQHALQYREKFGSGGSPRDMTPEQIAAERARMASATDDGWTSVGTYDPSISDQQIALGLYARLAGEVEARAVQKRLDMTPAERRARPPWMDYDVPEDQQIVRFADGKNTPASQVMFAIRAFHGTPADFDEFKAPVFFDANRRGADQYRQEGGGGDNLNGLGGQSVAGYSTAVRYVDRYGDAASALSAMRNDLGVWRSRPVDDVRNIWERPRDLMEGIAYLENGGKAGRIIEVEIPEPEQDYGGDKSQFMIDGAQKEFIADAKSRGYKVISFYDGGELVVLDTDVIKVIDDGRSTPAPPSELPPSYKIRLASVAIPSVSGMTAKPERADGSGPMFALREIEQTWGPKWDIYMGQQYRIAEAGYDYATMYDILAGKLSKASGIEPAMRAAMQAKMRELYDDMGPEGRAAAGIKELPPQDALDSPMAALAGQEPPDPSLDQAITELKEALGVAQAGGTSGNPLMRFLRRTWSTPPPAAVAQGLRGVTVRQDDREMRLRPRSNVRGQTDRATGLMTVRQSRDLETIAHEGGHGLEQLIGTPLDEVKAEHWRDLIPAVDEVPAPFIPTGYAGIELDAYEQGLLTIAAQRAYELSEAAEAAGTSVGQRLSAAAIGALIGGSIGAAVGTAVGNQIGGPVGGMVAGTVAATVGMATGGMGRMSSVERASQEPAKVAAVLMAEAHANLARAVGTRKADALLDDVVAEPRDDVAAYVAGRFSPTGTPRARLRPTPDAPALSEAFARWFERYVMDPDGAKKDAPNFHAAFEDTLDAEVPGVTEALAQVQQTYRAYMMQSPLERAAADVVSMNAGNSWERLAEDGSFENIQGKLRSAYNGIYDRLNPVWHGVRRLLEVADRNGIRDENGRRISLKVAENPYKLMRLFGSSYNRGRMWLEAGIADLGQTDIKGPSLLAALEVAYGGRAKSQWTPAIHQEFGAYLISRRAVAEYDRLARKKAALEAMDRTLVAAREQRSELVAEAAQERGVLARREDALIRTETRLTDTRREMRSAETAVRNLEERLREKADDILAAQMARNPNLETRRRREMQTLERDARREVRRFETARDAVSELEIERTMLTSEIEQRRASVEDMETRLRDFDEAVDALRTERQRTEKRGASRPPTLQPREFHARIIGEFEAKYPGGEEGVGDFREASRLVYEWTHRLLTLRYQAGFISNELYEELTTRKGFYVPFQRDMSDMSEGDVFMRGGAGKWSPFKKFDGSDRAIVNPLEALSQQAYTTAQQIAFNDAIGMLAKLAQRVGPGGAQIAEVLPRTETLPANESTIDRITDLAISMGYDPVDAHNLVMQMEQNFSDADVTLVWSETNKSPIAPPQLPYWVNGERQLVRLNDPVFGRDMFDAINGLGHDMSHILVEYAATSARWLRTGVTTHPNFIFRNLLRDIPSAFIRAGVIPFKGHWEGLKILRNNEEEVTGTGLGRGDFLRLYNEVGGIVGGQNVASLSRASQRYDVRDLRNTGPMGVGVNKIFHVVEAIETAGRLGIAAHAYRRAIMHNPNLTQMEAMQEAAYVARDVYDWGRNGSKMLGINRTITFLNAALQSVESALRGVTGSGDRGAEILRLRAGGTLAGSMAVGVGAGALVGGLPGMALGAMAASKAAQHIELVLRKESDGVISEAEERDIADAYKTWFRLSAVTLFFMIILAAMKDDPWYEDIKDGTKSTHAWLRLSRLGSVINHRINQGAEMLGIKSQKDAAAEQVAKALGHIGTEWAPDWLKRYLQIPDEWRIPKPFEWALPGNIAEVIYDGIEGRDPRVAERIRATAWEVLAPPHLPQAALVGVGAYYGYDLRNKRDIVPDRLKKLTPHEQFDAFSTQMSIDLSRAIYDLGARVGMKPERVPSPKMIDWVLSNQGAYWGKDIANAYDVAKRAAGLSNREAGSIYDVWIVAGITGRGYRNSKSIEEFWKLHGQEGGKMATAFQTYKSMIDESGQPERAAEFLARLEPEERAYALLRYHHRSAQPFGVSYAEASHPLVRAAAVHKIGQDIRKDMILGRLVESKRRGARDFETNIVLSPTKQAEIHDILERLSQIEVRNSMILLEREGWKGRPYLDPKPVLDELKAASEPVFDVYEAAASKARVRDWDDVREVWPINRRELLQNGADASLQ